MTKPLAVFDADGTIVRGTMTEEMLFALLGDYPVDHEFVRATNASCARIARQECSYHEHAEEIVRILRAILVGRRREDLDPFFAIAIARMRGRMHPFTRYLLEEVQDSHTCIAITGSPHEIIDPLLDEWGIHYAYGSEFELADGCYTGKEVRVPVYDKKLWLDTHLSLHGGTLNGSIGIGDTKSDIKFLNHVSLPIVFNPDYTLLQHARVKKWWIVLRADEDVLSITSPSRKVQDFHYDPIKNSKQLRGVVHFIVKYNHNYLR